MTDYKPIILDYAVLAAMDDTTATAALRVLTSRQQSVLLSLCEQLTWRTRWLSAPSEDTLNELDGDISEAIMADIDLCGLVETCLADSETILQILQDLQDLQDQ